MGKRDRRRGSPATTTGATAAAAPAASGGLSRRLVWIGLALALTLVAALAWWSAQPDSKRAPAPEAAGPRPTGAEFVGSESCSQCHQAQHAAWKTSQHALAMQHASAGTVRGNFDDASHTFDGVTSTFYKRDGRHFVRTDGPDGKLADFEVKYTFGLEPLQQYLVELPGGRLQALAVTWDTRPADQGGQRWFRQYPDEKLDFRDELHWTQRSQNWNFMCADCHSTQRDARAMTPRRAAFVQDAPTSEISGGLRGVPRARLRAHRMGRRRKPSSEAGKRPDGRSSTSDAA